MNNIEYNNFNLNGSKLDGSKVIMLPSDAVNNVMTNAYYTRSGAGVPPEATLVQPIVEQPMATAESVVEVAPTIEPSPLVESITVSELDSQIQPEPIPESPLTIPQDELINEEPVSEPVKEEKLDSIKFMEDIQDVIRGYASGINEVGSAVVQKFALEIDRVNKRDAELDAREIALNEKEKDLKARSDLLAQGKEMLAQAQTMAGGTSPSGPALTLINPDAPLAPMDVDLEKTA